MTRADRRVRHGAWYGAIGVVVLLLASVSAEAGGMRKSCNDETMRGTYIYAYSGFAVAGLVVFNGKGTSHGIWTTITEGQAAAHKGTFHGTYKVNADCSATETDTDQNGNIFHYDDFTSPDGREISFVQTDPDVVSSGTETRR